MLVQRVILKGIDAGNIYQRRQLFIVLVFTLTVGIIHHSNFATLRPLPLTPYSSTWLCLVDTERKCSFKGLSSSAKPKRIFVSLKRSRWRCNGVTLPLPLMALLHSHRAALPLYTSDITNKHTTTTAGTLKICRPWTTVVGVSKTTTSTNPATGPPSMRKTGPSTTTTVPSTKGSVQ